MFGSICDDLFQNSLQQDKKQSLLGKMNNFQSKILIRNYSIF